MKLTKAQREVLDILDADGGYLEATRRDKIICRKLIELGLVETATYHSRNPHVRITDAGREALKEIIGS